MIVYRDQLYEKRSNLSVLYSGGNDRDSYLRIKYMIKDVKLSRLKLEKQKLDDSVRISKQIHDEVMNGDTDLSAPAVNSDE